MTLGTYSVSELPLHFINFLSEITCFQISSLCKCFLISFPLQFLILFSPLDHRGNKVFNSYPGTPASFFTQSPFSKHCHSDSLSPALYHLEFFPASLLSWRFRKVPDNPQSLPSRSSQPGGGIVSSQDTSSVHGQAWSLG